MGVDILLQDEFVACLLKTGKADVFIEGLKGAEWLEKRLKWAMETSGVDADEFPILVILNCRRCVGREAAVLDDWDPVLLDGENPLLWVDDEMLNDGAPGIFSLGFIVRA